MSLERDKQKLVTCHKKQKRRKKNEKNPERDEHNSVTLQKKPKPRPQKGQKCCFFTSGRASSSSLGHPPEECLAAPKGVANLPTIPHGYSSPGSQDVFLGLPV
jgi:hypothetical protein